MKLAEFLIAAVLMELTPGPNMTWLALLSAQEGRKAGLAAVAGVTVGLALLAGLAATGSAALLDAYPALYEIIRWAGVLFLLYLAVETWFADSGSAPAGQGATRHFGRGFLVNVLNPKAAAVFLVLIPQFADAPVRVGQVIVLSAIYVAIATSVHLLIVAFAGSFARALDDPRHEKLARRIFAVLLAGVAVWVALTTARPG